MSIANICGQDKIAIVSIFYAPEQIGVSKYTTEMAEWLVQQGIEVHVVTAMPFYPEWMRRPGYPILRFSNQQIDGVKVTRCPLWIPNRVTMLTRLLHLFTFAITSNLAVLGLLLWKPAHIVLVMPTIVSAPAVLLAKAVCSSQVWLHVQDFELDLALEIVARRPRYRRFVENFERWLYCRFDAVSSISRTMMRRLSVDKGVAQEDSFFFPNWVDTTTVFPCTDGLLYRDEWGLNDDSVVVMYSGNLGQKYDFDVLIDAARQLMSVADITFVLCGDGAQRSHVEGLCKDADNVRFLPLQPRERLNELLNSADIHILPQRPHASDSVMPSKLLNIFACARPVIGTVHLDSEVGQVLSKVGMISKPGSVEQLAQAIRSLADQAQLRESLGKKAHDYVTQSFGKQAVLSAFLKRMQQERI